MKSILQRAAPGIATISTSRGIVLAVVAVFAAALAIPLLGYLAQPGPEITGAAVEDLAFGHVRLPGTHTEVSGFESDERGLTLAPADEGRFLYRVTKSPGDTFRLTAWFYASPPNVGNRLAIAIDGGPPETVAENRNLDSTAVPLPAGTTGARTIDLLFTATNHSDHQVLAVDQFSWSTQRGRLPVPPGATGFAGLGLLAIVMIVMRAGLRPAAVLTAVAFGLLLGAAAWLRFDALQRAADTLLDPDAITYRTYALRFQYWPLDRGLFCGCYGVREPFYLLLLRIVFDIAGSTQQRLRELSSVLSIAMVPLTVAAVRRRAGWPLALVAGAVVAFNGPLIQESSRGLRTELETDELLGLYLWLDREPVRRSLREALGVGLFGAIGVLTRSYYLPLVAIAGGLSFMTRYRPWQRGLMLTGLALAMVALAEAGHRWGLHHTYHDFQYDSYFEGRSWANIEYFDYHHRLLHPELLPTKEQLISQGYLAGPYLTYSQYLLLMHPLSQVVRDTALGYWSILTTFDGFLQLSPGGQRWRQLDGLGLAVDAAVKLSGVVGLLGMVVGALRRPRLAVAPVMVLGAIAVQTFLYQVGMLERYRLTIEVFPLELVAGAWVIQSALPGIHWPAVRWPVDWAKVRLAAAFAMAAMSTVGALLVADHPAAFPGLLTSMVFGLALMALSALSLPVGAAAFAIAFAAAGADLGVLAAAGSAAGAALVGWRRRSSLRSIAVPVVLAALGILASGAFSEYGVRAGQNLRLGLMAGSAIAVGGLAARAGGRADRLAALGLLAGAAALSAVMSMGGTGNALGSPPIAGLVLVIAASLFGAEFAAGHPVARPAAALGLAVAGLWFVASSPALLGAAAALAVAAAFSIRRGAGWRAIGLGGVAGGVAVALAVTGIVTYPVASTSGQPTWRTYLARPTSTVHQRLEVAPGADSLWVYGRRASDSNQFQTRLSINGAPAINIDSKLSTAPMSWARVPVTDPALVWSIEVSVIGDVDSLSRYVEFGGVSGHRPGAVSTFLEGGRPSTSLTPDGGVLNGTFLILAGRESGPEPPPGLHVPPFDESPATPRPDQPLAAERNASPVTRDAAGVFDIWHTAYELFRAHPWFGTGLGGVDLVISQFGGFGRGVSARDQYLESAAGGGLLALIALAGLLALAARAALRAGGIAGVAMLAALAGLAAAMLGESLLDDPNTAVLAWLVIGASIGLPAGRSPLAGSPPRPRVGPASDDSTS